MSGLLARRLRRWELAGFLITGALGPLLHFVYRWSGGNPAAGAFSAVNESVWEHMKILFLPLFLTALVEMVVFTQRYRNFLAVKFLAVMAGVALMPVLYYTYTGVWGRGCLKGDILLFYLCAAASQVLSCRLLEQGRLSGAGWQVAGLFGLWAVAFLFVYCTYHPPGLAIFQDPVTGRMGL